MIFLSYRRQDSKAWAGRIYDRLKAEFGAKRLFMDVDAIEPGEDFVEVLEGQVAQCEVMLVVMGPTWRTVTDANGRRRLDDPNDFVRIEVESALRAHKRVIPVLVDGAPMPRADELPTSMQRLVRRNAVTVSHNNFGSDTDGLIRALKKAAAQRPRKTRPAPPQRTDGGPPTSRSASTNWRTPAVAAGIVIGLLALWRAIVSSPSSAPEEVLTATGAADSGLAAKAAPVEVAREEPPASSTEGDVVRQEPPPPAEYRVTFDSEPRGAEVRRLKSGPDPLLGTTPFTKSFPAGRSFRVRFARDGYKPATRSVPVTQDATIRVELAALPRPRSTDMVDVPGGPFFMGCNEAVDTECYEDEKPGRTVSVEAFRIDKTEVTVAAYRKCVQAGGCSAEGLTTAFWNGEVQTEWSKYCNWNKSGRDRHPINCVNWEHARRYCAWANKRLPTEAEWEKAARGTDRRTYAWGNKGFGGVLVANIADASAKRVFPSWTVAEGYDDGFVATAPVGSFSPAGDSPFGAQDMIGNVLEWTADWYVYGDIGRGKFRSLRGGSWYDEPGFVRASDRVRDSPSYQSGFVGFRCVQSG